MLSRYITGIKHVMFYLGRRMVLLQRQVLSAFYEDVPSLDDLVEKLISEGVGMNNPARQIISTSKTRNIWTAPL